MADQVLVDNGAEADYTVSTDDAGASGQVQRVKLAMSADGSATHVQADADGVLVNLGTNNDVTLGAAIPAGTNNIGDVDVLSLPALPAGSNNIGDVDVLSVIPGTGATNLGKAIDTAVGATDTGVLELGVRDDALATLTEADGDATPARRNARGATWVALDSTVAQTVSLAAGANNIGDVDVLTLPALPAGTNNIGDVDIASIAAGDNNIGNVDIVTMPALPAGTNNIGDVDVLSLPALPAGTNNIGDVDVLTLPNVTLAAGTNTNEVVGDVAQDAAIAGNPVSVGGRASSAVPTAMSANGDSVYTWHDLSGATVIAGYVAADAAVAGNPVLNGARASTAVPTAMSADGDAVHLWADLNGSLVVRPRIKQLDIAVTPTIDTAVYASGDRLGSVMTFANAALVSGGTGTVVGARLVDDAASNFEIWLHLFKVSPTLANADNGALDITDANLATAIYVATIKFPTTETIAFATSNRACQGLWLGGPPAVPYETSGSSSLFGVLEARGAYDAAATDDLVVTLSVIRD